MHLILLGTFLSDAGPQKKVNRPGTGYSLREIPSHVCRAVAYQPWWAWPEWPTSHDIVLVIVVFAVHVLVHACPLYIKLNKYVLVLVISPLS